MGNITRPPKTPTIYNPHTRYDHDKHVQTLQHFRDVAKNLLTMCEQIQDPEIPYSPDLSLGYHTLFKDLYGVFPRETMRQAPNGELTLLFINTIEAFDRLIQLCEDLRPDMETFRDWIADGGPFSMEPLEKKTEFIHLWIEYRKWEIMVVGLRTTSHLFLPKSTIDPLRAQYHIDAHISTHRSLIENFVAKGWSMMPEKISSLKSLGLVVP